MLYLIESCSVGASCVRWYIQHVEYTEEKAERALQMLRNSQPYMRWRITTREIRDEFVNNS